MDLGFDENSHANKINFQKQKGDIVANLLPHLKGDRAQMHDQEENLKGSITQGKLADLVILDKNPLKVEPVAIKDIVVLETLKEGNTIYKKVE